MSGLSLRITLIIYLICLRPGGIVADEWKPPERREFFSRSQKYSFTIRPLKQPWKRPGNCYGILYARQKTKDKVWARNLINNIAPRTVFVSNSGKYVLTMDEWGHVGELPVVIYGEGGELIKVHNLDSLGLARDRTRMKLTVGSLWWNESSIAAFSPDEKYFCIKLHWGKLLIIDLSTGWLEDEHTAYNKERLKELIDSGEKAVEEQAFVMLASSDAQERVDAAVACGALKLVSAIPRLKSLLNDHATYLYLAEPPKRKVFYVRKAAKEALEKLGISVGEVITEERVKK